MERDKSQIIRRNARDAYLLIEHLARSGHRVGAETQSIIFKGFDLQKEDIASFDEAMFWREFSELAEMAKPIRIESLKILAPLVDESKSGSYYLATWIFRDVRIFIVFVSSITLIFFFTLIYYVQDASALNTAMQREDSLRRERIALDNNSLEQTRLSGSDVKTASKKIELTKIAIKEDYQRIMNWLYSRYDGQVDPVIEPYLRQRLGKKKNEDISEIEEAAVNRLRNEVIGGETEVADRIIWIAKVDQERMGGYIIPIIAAVLGSCVYILRRTSLGVYNYSISNVSMPLLILRLCVGAIAGVAIGWVYRNEIPEWSLEPIALSFLVGYSVEILFSILDKITVTFSEPVRK
ncbi:hypothetical protein [Aurantimonas sp. A3-2-R12]|uniref:hypothetical protein n=1 Tax=Aurantimonas sp. A3-2-R12 TaxID=3114362 RepID=UPI002E17AAE6|nr:hypothetical protein [Aurantimonas sp. A3-2-R12]